MRIVATTLICFLLILNLGVGLGKISQTSPSNDLQQRTTERDVSPVKSLTETSDSMVHFFYGENQSATVILDNQSNLTWTTVGSSTYLNPPIETREKIDSNLLNLTGLVTKGYLDDNQTNVIVSFSNKNSANFDNRFATSLIGESHFLYQSYQAFPQMNYLVTRLNYTTIFNLAKSSQISHIWLDRKFQVYLDQSVRLIKNPIEWAQIEASYHRSINGTGVKIAILDTGIDATHPDFYFPNGTSKIAETISFTGEPTTDGFGHGTHCASIAAGTGAASSSQYTGVAPGASLLNVKVISNQGSGYESWIISGIQWAVDHNANVLSMSFGSDTGSYGTDPMSTTVNWATQQGAVCTIAAGNSGPDMYTVASPAGAESAITVGASAKDDSLASFSSIGPTDDYRIKPDVLAPGVDIVAARASGTSMGTSVSEYYTMASGTSMATPHVAGAAALLLDAHPSWVPLQVKSALANYARDLGYNVLQQGSGRIDVCRAATASIEGNSSVSFGAVTLNTIYKSNIRLQNLGNTALTASLSVETWLIGDGTRYPAATLNSSTLYFSQGSNNTVELKLNATTGLPNGYFEGRFTITFGTTSIRIPFFFCVISQLNVEVVNESGSKLEAAFSLIDTVTGEMKAFCSETDKAHFRVSQGTYIIQAMNVYAWEVSGSLDAAISFVIHQKLSVGINEVKNLQLSLASAYKVNVRTTDINGALLHLTMKEILTPYYTMIYDADLGTLASQNMYLTNVSQYMKPPAFFGFTGLSNDDAFWSDGGVLATDVDDYFIGWDISKFGLPSTPANFDYANSDLATFDIENLMPKSTSVSMMWFNQIAGLWLSGFWHGVKTYPGITWKVHILPYQYKANPSANYTDMEWSCIYTTSTYPREEPENFVIDRHFQPITKGENFTYHMGKTPLLPQTVYDSPPYCGSGLFIPYYPLTVEKNLYLSKTDLQAKKRVEVQKDGFLISNETKSWALEPIAVGQIMQSAGYGLYTFTVKTETSLNCSSRNVAKYVINYTNSNTDLIPPTIVQIDGNPCFTVSGYGVTLQIMDNHQVSNVSLSYCVDGSSWLSAALRNMGQGYYSANITIPTNAQELSLTVEASDGAGNSIWYRSQPVAKKGYETRLAASIDSDRVSGRLSIIGGQLLQQVFLRAKFADGRTMYTLTNSAGDFGFSAPQSLIFPLVIQMACLGQYDASSCTIYRSGTHDLRITMLESPLIAVASNTRINLTLLNQGAYAENCTVTVRANTTPVASQVITIASGSSANVTLTWNTAGFATGNYSMSARSIIGTGGANVSEYNFVGGWTFLTFPGDLTGQIRGVPDGKVDMRDVFHLISLFNTNPTSPKWDPNADLNEDRRVDLRDIFLAIQNFGKTLL